MEVHFPPELERRLADSAANQGRNPDELVQDLVTRYLAEEVGFVEAVRLGEAALLRGDSISHDQVGERLQRFLRA
jgi:predicted transcriptional regulator